MSACGTRDGRWFAAAAAATLGLLLAAYSNVFRNEFHFDDAHVLVDNLWVRSLGNAPRFFTDAGTFSNLPANATYRPVSTLSLALDYAVAGRLDPVVFHGSQIAEMALLGTALFFLYRRLLDGARPDRANRWLALFGAALFTVHTLNTEAMNLMHARSEILSALGVAGAFLIYLRGGWGRRVGAHSAAMMLGALAKPPAIVFGPLLFAWVVLHRRWRDPGVSASPRPWRRAAREGFVAALPPTVLGALVYLVTVRMNAAGQSYGGGDRYHYALTQAWAWLHYLRLAVLPVGLSADTDLALVRSWYDARVLAGSAAVAVLAWAGWRAARSERLWPAAFGIAWFALGLAPTSTVLPLAEPVNEHRPFLGLVGLVFAATWAAREAWASLGARLRLGPRARRALPVGVACAVLLAHAAGTYARNRSWRDAASLWGDVTRKSPGNGRGWMNYGLAFMARGEWGEARRCLERAQALLPNYVNAAIKLGVLEGAVGNQESAERHFRRALRLAPADPTPHLFFARWLVDRGRGPEAIVAAEEAARLTSGNAPALGLLLDLHGSRGAREQAAAVARRYLAIDPSDPRARAYAAGQASPDGGRASYPAAFRQGVALGVKGKNLEAALAYRAALADRPDSADAWNNLGYALARLGFYADALAPLEQAVRLEPDLVLARNNLAWVRGEIEARRR